MSFKTDFSIHTICVAGVKRSTMKPYDFKWTNFYTANEEFFRLYPGFIVNLHPHELVICSTIIDSNNWSVLTTQQLITNESGNMYAGNIEKATIVTYGDFKGGNRQLFTLGELVLQDKTSMRYFIETGRASMVMINAVKRRVRLSLQ